MSIDANLNHKVRSKVILKEKRVFGFSKLIMAAAAIVFGGADVVSGSPNVSAQPSYVNNGSYVSIGDSVAAGAGLPGWSAMSLEDEVCGRSNFAYPHLVASRLNQEVGQLACLFSFIALL